MARLDFYLHPSVPLVLLGSHAWFWPEQCGHSIFCDSVCALGSCRHLICEMRICVKDELAVANYIRHRMCGCQLTYYLAPQNKSKEGVVWSTCAGPTSSTDYLMLQCIIFEWWLDDVLLNALAIFWLGFSDNCTDVGWAVLVPEGQAMLAPPNYWHKPAKHRGNEQAAQWADSEYTCNVPHQVVFDMSQ